MANSVVSKTITYKLGSISLTFVISYMILGGIEEATAITLLGHCASTTWYMFHEKIWHLNFKRSFGVGISSIPYFSTDWLKKIKSIVTAGTNFLHVSRKKLLRGIKDISIKTVIFKQDSEENSDQGIVEIRMEPLE